MKTFWKTFILSIIFFISAIYLGSHSYTKVHETKLPPKIGLVEGKVENKMVNMPKKEMVKVEENFNSLDEAFKKSKRINVLLLGLEDIRTDTIILASFHPNNKKVDIISIPRDTYVHRKGYDQAELRKLNAIYGSHGPEGVKKALSHILLGVPIHNYVIIDYKGVENIVDSIGGVEVMVPFHMKYSDPTSNPPLNIDIPEGKQKLNGKESLDFLRYRKGNKKNSGYIDGDLGRIKAQQEFLKAFIDKTMSYKLPLVVKSGFKHVETDISLMEAVNYSTNVMGINMEDIKFQTLPGEAEFKRFDGKVLSYFIHDSLEIKSLMEEIYNIKKPPKS